MDVCVYVNPAYDNQVIDILLRGIWRSLDALVWSKSQFTSKFRSRNTQQTGETKLENDPHGLWGCLGPSVATATPDGFLCF